MSIITTPVHEVVLPPTDLPSEDGVPLESDWHRLEMNLLIELVTLHLGPRDDYFVGGNMFIYFDAKEARNQNFRGPDFFLVWDVPLNPPRPYWAVWDEGGKYPDIIIELTSPSTAKEDHGVKKRTYEKVFRTSEYFIYDPAEQKLDGWRLGADRNYEPIQANQKGWLWSDQLGLWLGTWTGDWCKKQAVYLRLFNKSEKLVACADERLDAEKQRADVERQRAEVERQRADAEKQRADAEKLRADEAEAELRLLRSQSRQG